METLASHSKKSPNVLHQETTVVRDGEVANMLIQKRIPDILMYT